MNILWIDDDPRRFAKLHPEVRVQCNVFFAHGFEQINHYLNHSGKLFHLIICDHDMPLMDGMAVVKKFFEHGTPFCSPLALCSNNPAGRKNMLDYLNRLWDGGEFSIVDEPFYKVVDCDIVRDDFGEMTRQLLGIEAYGCDPIKL